MGESRQEEEGIPKEANMVQTSRKTAADIAACFQNTALEHIITSTERGIDYCTINLDVHPESVVREARRREMKGLRWCVEEWRAMRDCEAC